MRAAAGILVLASALASTPGPFAGPNPIPGFPRVVFWAWEHPENLPFLDPKRAAVAMLSGTITMVDGDVRCQPRMQPLHVPPSTPLLLTVRIESNGTRPGSEKDVAGCAISFAQMPGAKGLQIDFDGRRSERQWYRELLVDLRQRLPSAMVLTITALASWCEQDGWIRGLPIAEAVPMLFRMGPGEVWNGRDFEVGLCRSSVGVATDELPRNIPAHRRVYFFHPSRWTEDSYRAAWLATRSFQ